MNPTLELHTACLNIQQLERTILKAKASAKALDIPYVPGIEESMLQGIYTAISAAIPGIHNDRDYRAITNLVYSHSLAELSRLFTLYGISTDLPEQITKTPTGYAAPGTAFNDADVIGWFGATDQIDTINRLQDELTYIGKYVQRYHPNAKDLIKYAIKFKMHLRSCKTLPEAISAIKALRGVQVTCDVNKFLPVPGGLLKGSETYWAGLKYVNSETYYVPYMLTDYNSTEDLSQQCSILEPHDLAAANKTVKYCFTLLSNMAVIYNDMKNYRRFDNGVIFPLNSELQNQVIASDELTPDELYLFLNYTDPSYVFMFFRFFTDVILRYRKIADALIRLINHSLEYDDGEES